MLLGGCGSTIRTSPILLMVSEFFEAISRVESAVTEVTLYRLAAAEVILNCPLQVPDFGPPLPSPLHDQASCSKSLLVFSRSKVDLARKHLKRDLQSFGFRQIGVF